MATLVKSGSLVPGVTGKDRLRQPCVWDWTLTTAEVNGTTQGGYIIVPAEPGYAFMPTSVAWKCTGAAAGATLLRVADADGGVIMSHVVADCTDGVWVGLTGGTVVVTKLGFPTAVNKNIVFQPTVANLTTTTAVRVIIAGFYL